MPRTRTWNVAVILIGVLLPVFCMSQDGYQELIALHQEVQELRRPALVDGVPDFSAESVGYVARRVIQPCLSFIDPNNDFDRVQGRWGRPPW
jgi:hypothetical protein